MASQQRKREYPPLLQPGFRPFHVIDIERQCVAAFNRSQTRRSIAAGLRKLLTLLTEAGVSGELWVDGSFMTAKIDPEDVDVVLRLQHAELHTDAIDVLRHLANNQAALKDKHLCDFYAFIEYPQGHPLHAQGEHFYDYWARWFGQSRTGEAKGLAVVSLPVRSTWNLRCESHRQSQLGDVSMMSAAPSWERRGQ